MATALMITEIHTGPGLTDTELQGARHVFSFIEPLHWAEPDVLVISHHDYFESTSAEGSIHGIGRTYEITQNLSTGKATVKVVRPGE